MSQQGFRVLRGVEPPPPPPPPPADPNKPVELACGAAWRPSPRQDGFGTLEIPMPSFSAPAVLYSSLVTANLVDNILAALGKKEALTGAGSNAAEVRRELILSGAQYAIGSGEGESRRLVTLSFGLFQRRPGRADKGQAWEPIAASNEGALIARLARHLAGHLPAPAPESMRLELQLVPQVEERRREGLLLRRDRVAIIESPTLPHRLLDDWCILIRRLDSGAVADAA